MDGIHFDRSNSHRWPQTLSPRKCKSRPHICTHLLLSSLKFPSSLYNCVNSEFISIKILKPNVTSLNSSNYRVDVRSFVNQWTGCIIKSKPIKISLFKWVSSGAHKSKFVALNWVNIKYIIEPIFLQFNHMNCINQSNSDILSFFAYYRSI